MCGIVGYIGNEACQEIILGSLQRLEYRGYDSAGIMMYDGKNMHLSKTKGKVSDLEEITNQEEERKEDREILNSLKELAQRQLDLNEQIKDIMAALEQEKDPDEEEVCPRFR